MVYYLSIGSKATDGKGEKTMTKTVNNKAWKYEDSEGAWWNADESECITRSERNQNVWVRWDGINYAAGEEYKTLKKAMA